MFVALKMPLLALLRTLYLVNTFVAYREVSEPNVQYECNQFGLFFGSVVVLNVYISFKLFRRLFVVVF